MENHFFLQENETDKLKYIIRTWEEKFEALRKEYEKLENSFYKNLGKPGPRESIVIERFILEPNIASLHLHSQVQKGKEEQQEIIEMYNEVREELKIK